ncbi:magnesium and cobalt transporter [Epibacterium ulvae]|uniref:Magnesium and cobalt transporter n=1 Tax=Epibacterium ulvae TaxID=1156985 RepID=A0A1G5PM69_9RHOB|nr:hemolysin family protein [Epibacterium ulvae]SCZ50634.1 magnesium and cobalt transporter [Epibacterium ulvae]
MGDIEGSSNAAQSALQNASSDVSTDTVQKTGFFGRLFGSISVSDTKEQVANAPVAPQDQPLHGMINLRRMRVQDVAIPVAEIVSVSSTTSKDELVQVFRDSGFTRIPVYDGTLDTPLGMAHLKDFALTNGFNCEDDAFDLENLLRPLLFVPPSMTIGVLLTKMQAERRHMALVIDEYGGVDGLVTIEDLIEQVVGEIEDEHDTDESQTWFREKPGCFVAQARTPLPEFESEIGHALSAHDDVDDEDIDTLGGLVFMLSGRVPARGEVILHPDGTEFEVMDADPRRIKRLRVRLPQAAAE